MSLGQKWQASAAPDGPAIGVDRGYLEDVVTRIVSIGSSALGFRVAGTPEEHQVARYVAAELEAMGLQDVRLEPVPVDAWRFGGAALSVGDQLYECASFGGAPGTEPSGVAGELVFVGRGSQEDIAGLDLTGKIVLIDWRGGEPSANMLWPSLSAAQCAQAGAVAAVVTSLPGGKFYQAEGALGSCDAYCLPETPPLATIRKEDALELIARLRHEPLGARLTIDSTVTAGATGYNVTGVLPGKRPGAPIVVAGHMDAWFRGAIDDATGVAATLALAKALKDHGYTPEGPIVFGAHCAEEYGVQDSAFDWCIGSWWQIRHEHPEWGDTVPLYVNIEGTGMDVPLLVETPPELDSFVRGIFSAARSEGSLPGRLEFGRPRTWTEQYSFASAGVPTVGVCSAFSDFFVDRYHTDYDDVGIVDFDNLATTTGVYARLLIAADRERDSCLEPAARAADLRERGLLEDLREAGFDVSALDAAMCRFEAACARTKDPLWSRRVFATLSRALEAVDACERVVYPHQQALEDVKALTAACEALGRADGEAAVAAAERCGRNALARDLSAELLQLDAERHLPSHPGAAWAAHAHLTASPVLGEEIAALHGAGDQGSQTPWVLTSLRSARERSARDVESRLARMAKAFHEATDQPVSTARMEMDG